MKKQWIIGILLLLVAAFLVFKYAGSDKQGEANMIKIGAILPLTGKLSTMGGVEKNAMLLAVEKLKLNNKNIELIIEDSKSNSKDAVTAANNLISIKKVDLIITSTTGASLAVEPITSKNELNLLAFCMDPDVATKSPFVMRFYEGIGEEAKPIIKFLDTIKSGSKIGFLYAKVPAFEKILSQEYLPKLKASNKEVTFIESYEIGNGDFKNSILKLKDSKADNIVILGYGFEYPNIFNELKLAGLIGKIRIIGGWGFLYTSLDSTLLENIIVSGPEYVFKNSNFSSFFNEYSKAYGSNPNFDAAFAYSLIEAIGNNVTKTNVKRPLKELFSGKNFESPILGNFTFDSSGNMIVKTNVGIYKNGQIVELK